MHPRISYADRSNEAMRRNIEKLQEWLSVFKRVRRIVRKYAHLEQEFDIVVRGRERFADAKYPCAGWVRDQINLCEYIIEGNVLEENRKPWWQIDQ